MKKQQKLITKLALFIVPFFVVGMIIFSYILYQTFGGVIENQIESEFEGTLKGIEHKLDASGGLSNLLSDMVKDTYHSVNKQEYQNFLAEILDESEVIYGSGIWLEPYTYENVRFFGPYLYKSGTTYLYTEEYEDPNYDFTTQEWYQQAKEAGGEIVWTDPYLDESTGTVFLTVGKAIQEANGNVIGVVSVDLDISQLGGLIKEGIIGKNGITFLLTKNNQYIGVSNSNLSMTNIVDDSTAILAKAGEAIVNTSEDELYNENLNGYILKVQTLGDVGWKLGVLVDRSEFFGILLSMIIGLCFILIFLMVAVFFLIRAVVKTVTQILITTEEMNKGDLKVEFKGANSQELGILTRGLNNMVQSFREIIENIVFSSKEIKDKSDNTMRQSIEMKKMTQEQTQALSEITITMNEMTSAIGEVVESANELADIMEETIKNGNEARENAKKTVDISHKGSQDMNRINQEMTAIQGSIRDMSDSVMEAGNSAEQIRNIIEFIESVASQTNLLALNAAIEAARAGEAGKGFSVVADEIRKLAESTSTSTKQISDLVENVILVIQKAVEETNRNVSGINNSASLIDDTGQLFMSIVGAIEETNSKINNILGDVDKIDVITQELVSNTEEQSAASEEILATVESVSGMSDNLLANSEKVVVDSKNLDEVAMKLQNIISHFKI